MLGKLIKYELKATSRWFLPLYCGIIIFAIFSKISTVVINLEDIKHLSYNNPLVELIVNTAMLISGFLYSFVIITTIVMTFVIAIRRFYKNLLSDEGYLMFTLPISSHNLILSKLLTTIIWYTCSILVIIFSLFILIVNKDFLHVMSLLSTALLFFFNEIQKYPSFISFFVLILINLFISIPYLVLMIYASISIGHTRNSHKVLYSFGAFLGLDIIISIVSNIISFIFFFPYFNSFKIYDSYGAFNSIHSIFGSLNSFLIFSLFLSIALCVGFYFITNYILSKKLNLE